MLTASVVIYHSKKEEIESLLKSVKISDCVDRLYVIDNDFKYFNLQSGELSNEIKSTMCYPIKTIELREENTNVVYAQKIEDNGNSTTK